MSDDELLNVINILDEIAHYALKDAAKKRSIEEDSKKLAELTYDVHKKKKEKES